MTPVSPYERAVTAWGHWLLDNPRLAIALCVASVVVLTAGARHLTFSTDYRVYFSEDNPQLQAFDEMQNVYAKNDNTLFTLLPHEGDVFQPRVLEAVRTLTREAWKLPYTQRVASIANFQNSEAEGDDLRVGALLPDGAALTPERIAKVRAVAMAEPQLGNLVARDGRATAVNVVAAFPRASEREVPETVAAARALRDRVQAEHPELRIAMGGVNIVNIAFTEAAQADMKSLIPLMYVLVGVIAWLMLRSGWAVFSTMLLITFSTVTAMGLAGYLRIGLTPPALASTIVIMTLAVADAVHLFLLMFAAMRRGLPRREAILESLRINFTPVLITSLTTIAGFLSINFSDSPPLRDLGNIASFGVAMAWLYTIVLIPPVMLLAPFPAPVERRSRLTKLMLAWADFVMARPRAVLGATAAAALVLLACIPLNRVDDNFVRFFDERLPFRQDAETVFERLGGLFYIEYSLKADSPNGISDPAYLRKVEQFRDWWLQQPHAQNVLSITDVFKRLNRNMHGDDPAWYRLPEDRELAAQYLLLYEMSLPFGLDLTTTVNIDKSSSRFVVFLERTTTPEFNAQVRASEEWLRDNAPELNGFASGATVMFGHLTRRNLDSMIAQWPFLVLVIWALLAVSLRTFKVGLVGILPLALPTGMAFGLWALWDGWINFTMAVLLGVVTGIVDDDTVHFLNHYLHARRAGQGVRAAIRHAFEIAGAAMVALTAILVGGFLVLAQSSFLPNAGLGQLGAIAIAIALFLNLLLVPPILLYVDRERNPRPAPEGLANGSPA